MAYDFAEQYENSKGYDRHIDAAFEPWWEVENVGRLFERAGMDRLWTHRDTGRRMSVEYKSDTMAHRTKHVFVETESVVEAGKRGWAYTSCAQLLVYYVVEGRYAFVARMSEIERKLEGWELAHQIRDVRTRDGNSGNESSDTEGSCYTTRGILVPLMTFRAAASAVVEVSPPEAEGPPHREHTLPLKVGSGVLRCADRGEADSRKEATGERKKRSSSDAPSTKASLTLHEGGASPG